MTQPPMSYRYGDIVVPFISPDEPLAVQDRHFMECVASGTRPLTDGQNGLAVVEALEAAELSRRLGRPVLLEELSSGGRFARHPRAGNGHARTAAFAGGPPARVAAMAPGPAAEMS
jgi:hypothetical protein